MASSRLGPGSASARCPPIGRYHWSIAVTCEDVLRSLSAVTDFASAVANNGPVRQWMVLDCLNPLAAAPDACSASSKHAVTCAVSRRVGLGLRPHIGSVLV
jgi:hypothetical protein